jgi:hypothetical protein
VPVYHFLWGEEEVLGIEMRALCMPDKYFTTLAMSGVILISEVTDMKSMVLHRAQNRALFTV